MNWRLNDSNFGTLDKLKLCSFILNPKSRWTQGDIVKNYEDRWAILTDSWSVMVSSGSTANSLIASYRLAKSKKRKVIFPSVTWQTSVAPWIQLGLEPVFIDIELKNLNIDLEKLNDYLHANSDDINCIFATNLLGILDREHISSLRRIAQAYKVPLLFDNCENTIGNPLCSFWHLGEFTSSTSFYFGHQVTSVEGGMIFTKNQDEYEHYLMARNHGLTRSLLEYGIDPSNRLNPNVDSKFDFNVLGYNFRSTNINALIGGLSLSKIQALIPSLYDKTRLFMDRINENYLQFNFQTVMFCLPIILKNKNGPMLEEIKTHLDKNGIEHRPIISGNLLRQTCYSKYCNNPSDYPVAEHVHSYGVYVGLHNGVKEKQINKLVQFLNNL